MLSFGPNTDKVFLALGATDLRRSIDGLAAIVQQRFHLDPFSNNIFVFCNRSKDRLKILHWDSSGFWLYLKRLENSTFQWPSGQEEVKSLSMREFRWLLDGIPLNQPKAYQPVNAKVHV